MTILSKYIVILVSLVSISLAQETKELDLEIEILISKIKSAQVLEKRILINQLKIILRQVNKNNQIKAINELKKSFSNNIEAKNINFIQHNNISHIQGNRISQQSTMKYNKNINTQRTKGKGQGKR